MNKRLITIFIFTGILLLEVACKYESKKVEPIFQKAGQILDQKPDSALAILHEISDAEELKNKLYFEYFLLQIQAKYKSYDDISTDTLIFTIRDYFRKQNNSEKAALATYYSGKVLEEQKNYEDALQQFLETEQYLEQSDNLNLKGLCQSSIGKLYYNKLHKEKAITHFKLAKNYFHQAENYKNEIVVSNLIGNCLLMLDETDSAFSCYHDALELAEKYNYIKEQTDLRVSIGVGYRELRNWEMSELHFKEAWTFSNDSLQKARVLTNLAQLFKMQDKSDSSIFYLQRAIRYLPENTDNYLAANIYKTWSDIEIERNDFQNALEMYENYTDYLTAIFDESRNRAVLEIEKKYNYQLVENRNKQLLIERQRILLSFLLILLLLCFIIFLLFRYSKQNRRKLEDTEEKVRQLKIIARSFDAKEESFRNVLIRHFDIIKKAALIEGYLNESERKKGQPLLRRFNEVVYGQKNLDWKIIYETINKLSNGFFGKFRQQFPQLDESEFRICCLLYVDFNNTEIAILLNYSIHTVPAKKNIIRKKLGIINYGNIKDFMKDAIVS